MVNKWKAQGLLEDSGGATGLDLERLGYKGLGFCMLLKSNGSGLYATKDLALAVRKFETYAIDRSIYVVASEQSLHFKQVFKVLEHLGYEQAKRCFHLAYGYHSPLLFLSLSLSLFLSFLFQS
jgi:arginyl-tRNA synthetase